jgi:hypothetical protein
VFTSNKITALAFSTLFTLTAAGSAFAASLQSSNPVKGGSNVLVAQSSLLSRLLAVAETALADAIAQSNAISGPGKSALAQSFSKVSSLLGNATALSGSTALSDKYAVARSLSSATTVLGDALAIAQSNAISGSGKPALASALSTAQTYMGNAARILLLRLSDRFEDCSISSSNYLESH